MNEMEKMAKNLVSDLKTRISQLEATIRNVKNQRATTDTQELKDHLEMLFNKKTKSLEMELKAVKCSSFHPEMVSTTTSKPFPRARNLDNDNNLEEWRGKLFSMIFEIFTIFYDIFL